MAKVRCIKCGAKCCTCEGCNPKTYVNGLCPLCQQLEKKKNADKPDINSMSRLYITQDIVGENRLFIIQPVKEQIE